MWQRLTLHWQREGKCIRAWTNDKCLATKHHQTLFGDQTFYRLDTLFGVVWSCLCVFDCVWSCLIKFEGHQTFNQQLKIFLLYSCLMGDVLFVWTAAYQTCLKRACVPRLLSGLYQLFDLCLIKQVLTVCPVTSTLACLVTKQCLMVWCGQTFIVCPGPYNNNLACHITLCSWADAWSMWWQTDSVDFPAKSGWTRQFQHCHVMSQMLHAEWRMLDDAGNFKDLPVTGSTVSTFTGKISRIRIYYGKQKRHEQNLGRS